MYVLLFIFILISSRTVEDFGPLEAQDARPNQTVHDFGPLEAQRAPEIFRF